MMTPEEILEHLSEAARLLGDAPPVEGAGEPWPTVESINAEWHLRVAQVAMLQLEMTQLRDEQHALLARRVAGQPRFASGGAPSAPIRRHHGPGFVG